MGDPHEILGVRPGAGAAEVTAAWRRAAKRWHPDRGGGEEAEQRMREVNAAFEQLRAEALGQVHGFGRAPSPDAAAPAGEPAPPRRRRRRGAWLTDTLRAALGPELLAALREHEPVHHVARAMTWGSSVRVAVTDRRLLWLLDDAPVARVRSLGLGSVASVERRRAWPRRQATQLRVRGRDGRRHVFADLDPQDAVAIARALRRGLSGGDAAGGPTASAAPPPAA